MINVVYYTSTNFLESCIETIQKIKKLVNIHLLIEITEYSKQSTIINIKQINKKKHLVKPEELLNKSDWDNLKPYFNELASVYFVIHKNKHSYSFKTIFSNIRLLIYLHKINFDVFHFDSISNRVLGLYFYLKSKKIVITIHDAIPHTGENSWKEEIPNRIFYPIAHSFIFYSKYSANLFKKHYPTIHGKIFHCKLEPFSYYKTISKHVQQNDQNNYILFFGRISFYKGIDLLLAAIPSISLQYPYLKFLIIGKKCYDYNIKNVIKNKQLKNVILIDEYLETKKLVKYIIESKFIICPYRDASQSGVLMTSMALNKMSIVTNVGAFPEYIEDNINGLICDVDSTAIAEKIIEALKNDHYKEIENNIINKNRNESNHQISETILRAYK